MLHLSQGPGVLNQTAPTPNKDSAEAAVLNLCLYFQKPWSKLWGRVGPPCLGGYQALFGGQLCVFLLTVPKKLGIGLWEVSV